MLHKQVGRGYTQTLVLPDLAPAAGSEVTFEVIGRLRGTGAFDLHQVAARHSLHLVQSGTGIVVINGISRRLGANDAFCFYPGDHIHYREDPRDPWRYTWFGLLGPRVGERLDLLGYGRERMQAGIATPVLWRLLDDIEAAFLAGSQGPSRSVAAAWSIFAELEVGRRHADPSDPIRALAALLESGYDRGLRIEDLARDLGLDRSTLFRRFRDRYGCSPKAWLQRVRLERAKALVAAGDLTVAEIGRRCGFDDPRNLTRAYRARFGVTPGRRGG